MFPAILLSGVAGAASAQPPAPPSEPRVSISESRIPGGLARQAACAPATTTVQPEMALRIEGGIESRRSLFAPGDEVTLNAGTRQGVRAGEAFFVRRLAIDRIRQAETGSSPRYVHTAGVVEVVEAGADVSRARVTLGCDGIGAGDYLERFTPVVVPDAAASAGAPEFADPARVLLGADLRSVGAPGDVMLLDRGSRHGLRPGQSLTVFRVPAGRSGPLATIGTARVFAVTPETASFRIENSVDAVYAGDLVAVHR
jgi:hypothetical protein